MTLRVLSLSHQAAAAYKGKGRSQPTCRARGCRDRLGIPKPPPPGGGHAPRGAPSTRAARLLGRTHRPRLPGARCPRATLCQRPPCVRRAAHHRAKRRVGVWCSLPMLGPCAQRQRYATACCAYRPTFIRCLSINPPPPDSSSSSSSQSRVVTCCCTASACCCALGVGGSELDAPLARRASFPFTGVDSPCCAGAAAEACDPLCGVHVSVQYYTAKWKPR